MKSFFLFFLMILISNFVVGQNEIAPGGYLQTRLTSDYNTYPSFSVRRAKIWLKSENKLTKGAINFKIQTEFSTKHGANINLLDAKIGYKYKTFYICAGQQTPDFSLQRHQHDQYLPIVERSEVINNIVPAAETHARDIGVQVSFKFDSLDSHFSLGLFNGTGANQLNFSDETFLVTSRFQYAIIKNPFVLKLGGSAMYRHSGGLQYNKFFYKDSIFTGRDERFGIETSLAFKNFHFQTEFIKALLNKSSAFGYYYLADYQMNKSIFAIGYNFFQNVMEEKNKSVSFSYSYLFLKHNIKLSMAHYYYLSPQNQNLTILQFQYIF